MKTHFRNIIAVLALVVVLYIVTNYTGVVQEQIGVKGASTTRGQGIAGRISQDVGTQVDTAKEQAMHISLSDAVNYFSRFQRVPQDINNLINFTQGQLNNMLESKNKKK